MSRYVRNTAVLLKMEAAYNTDPIPDGATDAMLVSEFSCDDAIKYENAPEVRPYMGGSVDLVTEQHITGSLKVKLGGSGSLGVAAQWGKLFRIAGFAETITAATRVDRSPISSGFESGAMYYYDDGVLKKALGMRANLTGLKLAYGALPEAAFSFVALNGGNTAVALPSTTLTAWKKPLAVNSVNSSLVTLGCTYAAGALSGGTTVVSKGLELALGGKVDFNGMLGGETVDITDRNVTGKLTLDLAAADEISNLDIVKDSTTQGIGMLHGTTDGYKLLVFMPNVQLKNPKKDSLNGKRVITYDIMSVPSLGSGNDELQIVEL